MTAPTATEPLLLTVTEAAHLLSIGRATLYRLIGERKITPTDVGTTKSPTIRISRAELHAFIKRQAIR